MFKIRRFATLVLVLALLTTGGVYAAWNYAGTNAGYAISNPATFGLENVEYSTSRGTYTVSSNGLKAFAIDQTLVDKNNPANNNYTAKLVVNPDIKITITFTPNYGASEEVWNHGILSEFFLTFAKNSTQSLYTMDDEGNYTTENPTYSVPAITVDDTHMTINPHTDSPEDGKYYWTKNLNSDGDVTNFTFVIDATMLESLVALNNSATPGGTGFVLDCIEEYTAFAACLSNGYSVAFVVQDPTN